MHFALGRTLNDPSSRGSRPTSAQLFLQNTCLEFITIFPPKVVHILLFPFLFWLEWWAVPLDTAPHGFAWYCNILSLIYNCNRNTDVMNYGYKQRAASLSVCRFSDVLTSQGSRGVSRTVYRAGRHTISGYTSGNRCRRFCLVKCAWF